MGRKGRNETFSRTWIPIQCAWAGNYSDLDPAVSVPGLAASYEDGSCSLSVKHSRSARDQCVRVDTKVGRWGTWKTKRMHSPVCGTELGEESRALPTH